MNHKGKKFVIGYHPGSGMFAALSAVLNNIAWCEKKGKTPIIYWGPDTRYPTYPCNAPYYQEEGFNGSINVWEYYFEPISDEVYVPGEEIICYCIENFAPAPTIESSSTVENRDHRNKIKRALDRYVRVKPEVMSKVDAFYEKHMKGKKTIALHLRGTDKVAEIEQVKTEDICRVAQEYAEMIPGCQFFVCTDELSLLTKVKELLTGTIITYDAYRSEDGKPVHLNPGDKQSPAKIGEDVIIEALLMSRCDLFVHMCNNVATGVLYFNPDLDTVLLLPQREPIPNCLAWPT